jgi:hypothetical protein
VSALRTGAAFVVALTIAGCGSSDGDGPRDFGRDDIHDTSPGVTFEPAEYPTAPYGTRERSVIANLEFSGWKNPPAADYDPARLERVRLSDFYDPEGADVRYLFVSVVEVWCPVCRTEYSDIRTNDRYRAYRERGVEFLGILTEDADHNPAKPEDLVAWARDRYEVGFPMVLDPGFKTGAYHDALGTPLNMLIDARDMRILYRITGVPGGGTATDVVGPLWEEIDEFIE